MFGAVLVILFVGLLLLWSLRGDSGCDHDYVYYDEAGDPMSEVEWGEPCFSKCVKCGEVNVIPSGFQSDASFENFLSRRELGGSNALDKVERN